MTITVFGGKTLDLLADQAEEGLYDRHDPQVEQPVGDVLNRPIIDAMLENAAF